MTIRLTIQVMTIAVAMTFLTIGSDAATVSGVYTSGHSAPLADRQLHFENSISGDIFLARTGSDGSFAADLPAGTYNLRAERGTVVKSNIVVGESELSLGHVGGASALDILKLPFEGQGIGPALVDTGAPGTAHVAAAPDAVAPQSAATYWTPGSQESAPPTPQQQ